MNKQFGVPSVRKPPPAQYAAQLVLSEVGNDTNGLNGAGHIKSVLANQGHLIPQCVSVKTIYIFILFP